jgi:hypothetical protein
LKITVTRVFMFGLLLLATFMVCAATAVNLQTCTTTPTTGGLLGCPTANVVFAPVAPTTWVRSVVAGTQGWRAYSTLKPTDQVYTGVWVLLSAITVALQPTSTMPPATTAATQDVTIVSSDLPAQPVVFKGAPVPACFTVNAKQVCVP